MAFQRFDSGISEAPAHRPVAWQLPCNVAAEAKLRRARRWGSMMVAVAAVIGVGIWIGNSLDSIALGVLAGDFTFLIGAAVATAVAGARA
jgi:hypothetical protein